MRVILLAAVLALSCDTGTNYIDDLDPGYFTGTWVRITDVPLQGTNLYTKDTTKYRIGLDQSIIPDTVLRYSKPLSFVEVFSRGGTTAWYLRDPEGVHQNLTTTYQSIAVLTGERSTVTLRRPMDLSYDPLPDTLWVTLGNTDSFGLSKAR
jgi:hypothetical protein